MKSRKFWASAAGLIIVLLVLVAWHGNVDPPEVTCRGYSVHIDPVYTDRGGSYTGSVTFTSGSSHGTWANGQTSQHYAGYVHWAEAPNDDWYFSGTVSKPQNCPEPTEDPTESPTEQPTEVVTQQPTDPDPDWIIHVCVQLPDGTWEVQDRVIDKQDGQTEVYPWYDKNRGRDVYDDCTPPSTPPAVPTSVAPPQDVPPTGQFKTPTLWESIVATVTTLWNQLFG